MFVIIGWDLLYNEFYPDHLQIFIIVIVIVQGKCTYKHLNETWGTAWSTALTISTVKNCFPSHKATTHLALINPGILKYTSSYLKMDAGQRSKHK